MRQDYNFVQSSMNKIIRHWNYSDEFKHINLRFYQIADHAISRIIERNLQVDELYYLLHFAFKEHLCEIIYWAFQEEPGRLCIADKKHNILALICKKTGKKRIITIRTAFRCKSNITEEKNNAMWIKLTTARTIKNENTPRFRKQ